MSFVIHNRKAKNSEGKLQYPHGVSFGVMERDTLQNILGLSAHAFELHIYLLSQNESTYNPSYSALSKHYKASGATIKRWADELSKNGLLEIKRLGFKKSEWHVYEKPRSKNVERSPP